MMKRNKRSFMYREAPEEIQMPKNLSIRELDDGTFSYSSNGKEGSATKEELSDVVNEWIGKKESKKEEK